MIAATFKIERRKKLLDIIAADVVAISKIINSEIEVADLQANFIVNFSIAYTPSCVSTTIAVAFVATQGYC